jgi:hypothetical protein
MQKTETARQPEKVMLIARNTMVASMLGTLLFASGVQADTGSEAAAADTWAFKFTPSWYSTSNTRDATDLNLRVNRGPHALWLGYYRRAGEFEQTRTGYEYTLQTPFGQLVPSLQLASRGFVGGSVNAQIGGDPIYALLGFGRTNMRD